VRNAQLAHIQTKPYQFAKTAQLLALFVTRATSVPLVKPATTYSKISAPIT